jgi:hypothetical protein
MVLLKDGSLEPRRLIELPPNWGLCLTSPYHRASDRGRIGVFYAIKTPIGDDVGDLKYVFTKCENDPPDTFYPTYLCKNMTPNDLKCILLP